MTSRESSPCSAGARRVAVLTLLWPAVFGLPVKAQANDVVVLEYGHIHHMIEDQDPTPLLRIYQDGLVRVHYPVYMQRAGDYEFSLSAEELVLLFESVEAEGLLLLDIQEAAAEREAIEARQTAGGELFDVSDVTETVIRLRPSEVRGFSGVQASGGLLRTIRWPNVYTDARRYPELASVQSIAAVARRLQEILDRAVQVGQP